MASEYRRKLDAAAFAEAVRRQATEKSMPVVGEGLPKAVIDPITQSSVQHNLRQIQSEKFLRARASESVGGKGHGFAIVNVLVDEGGRIVDIGNKETTEGFSKKGFFAVATRVKILPVEGKDYEFHPWYGRKLPDPAENVLRLTEETLNKSF